MLEVKRPFKDYNILLLDKKIKGDRVYLPNSCDFERDCDFELDRDLDFDLTDPELDLALDTAGECDFDLDPAPWNLSLETELDFDLDPEQDLALET